MHKWSFLRHLLAAYIFENHGSLRLKDKTIQLPGACSDPSIPPHDPHHRRRLVHPGRPPLALGNRGHSGRLYQARPLWRQHNNPQHLRRVSLLALLLHSIPTWSQTVRVYNLELSEFPWSVCYIKIHSSLVWVLSAFTLGGLYYFAYTDVGIVNAIKMLWRL